MDGVRRSGWLVVAKIVLLLLNDKGRRVNKHLAIWDRHFGIRSVGWGIVEEAFS